MSVLHECGHASDGKKHGENHKKDKPEGAFGGVSRSVQRLSVAIASGVCEDLSVEDRQLFKDYLASQRIDCKPGFPGCVESLVVFSEIFVDFWTAS